MGLRQGRDASRRSTRRCSPPASPATSSPPRRPSRAPARSATWARRSSTTSWAAATTATSTASSTCRPTRPGSTPGSRTCGASACGSSRATASRRYDVGGGRVRVRAPRRPDKAGRRTRRGRLVRQCDARRAGPQATGRVTCSRVDPSLKEMDELFTDWMAGIQFYLNRKVDIAAGPPHVPRRAVGAHRAHPGRSSGPTATSPSDYGDGTAVDCLSVDISNWDAPGHPLRQAGQASARRQQIAREVLAQIRDHHDRRRAAEGRRRRTPGSSIPASSGTRPGAATPTRRRCWSTRSGSWEKRPTAVTKIPNLFLAGDYVQTDIDLATMEGANESGRGRGQRHPRRQRLERRARRRRSSSTTRRSSRRSRPPTRSSTRQGQPNPLDLPADLP